MTERNLVRLFYRLKGDIRDEFFDFISPIKINRTYIKLASFGANSKYDYSYEKLKNVPAFYEHEKKCILFNKALLKSLNSKLISNILYHELLHSVSYRNIRKQGRKMIVKSGFYKQIYIGRKKITKYRLLNEGVIQYFANKKTGYLGNSGYQDESKLISIVADSIGEKFLKKLFFEGEVEEFLSLIKKKLGKNFLKTLT